MTPDVNMIANGRGPRLRIAHLFCWAAGSALGFAAYHQVSPSPQKPEIALFVGMYNSVMGMALGAILTGIGIMAYLQWRDGMPYPSLPGHWLLIFGLAAAIADSVAIGVFRYLTRLYYPPEKWPPGTMHLPQVYMIQFRLARIGDVIGVYHQAVGWGLGAVAALALSWHLRRRLPWPWLAVFLAFFLTAATLSGGHIRSLILVHRTSTLTPIGPWCRHSAVVYARFILLGVTMMLGATAWDVWKRSRTDGLHWAGISVWVVAAAGQYATYRIFV
jgi:hypothetical protein